jgi:ornithine cyclodeaminase
MSVEILEWSTIEGLLPQLDVIERIAEGFRLYSKGMAVIPPVGELQFVDPPGEAHIKYGCLQQGDYYVVKIASGFYNNPQLGLPSCMGLMLLFSQKTGAPAAILLDEGRLTNIRTAAAGAVVAQALKPQRVDTIGILGTGTQARLQAQYLSQVVSTRKLVAWGRSPSRLALYLDDMRDFGFDVSAATGPRQVAELSQIIVTTTPAETPLLQADWIQPGTHITAVGSDTPEKQELDGHILAKADRVVADSRSQCRLRGEIHQALAAGLIAQEEVVELGEILLGDVVGRGGSEEITVADLTGVAVQDLQIAVAVLEAYRG